MEEKICVISWRWRQKGRRSHSRWSATESGENRELDLEERREEVKI